MDARTLSSRLVMALGGLAFLGGAGYATAAFNEWLPSCDEFLCDVGRALTGIFVAGVGALLVAIGYAIRPRGRARAWELALVSLAALCALGVAGLMLALGDVRITLLGVAMAAGALIGLYVAYRDWRAMRRRHA